MGFLDDAKSGAGRTLEGTVVDYAFTRGWPLGEGGSWIEDEDDRQSGENIYFVPKVQPEGADEDESINKPLYLGSGEYLAIEDDGKTLKARDEEGELQEDRAPNLYAEGDTYKFIASLAEAGFPVDTRFPNPKEEKVIDLRGLIGTRLRMTEENDAEATAKFGKKKIKKGKHKGKEFNRTYTKVVKVLSLPDEKKTSTKATKAGKSTKASKEEDDAEESGIDTKTADKFLKEVLKAEGKDGVVLREKLTLAVTRTLNKKKMDLNENAELRKFVTSEEYLTDAADRGVIDFDPTSKKQTISVA